MADVVITTANVGYGDDATLLQKQVAGETIAPGQVVYKAPSDNKFYLADNLTAAKADAVGIAMTRAIADQNFTVLTEGEFLGGAFLAGKLYELSSTAGAIAAAGDAGSGDFGTSLGIAKSTTVLFLKVQASGVAVA